MSCLCLVLRCRRLAPVWALCRAAVCASCECSEREFQETLLHEMIHLYIAYHNITDTSSHGKEFRRIMQRLNSEHGWHITVSTSMHKHKLTPSHPDNSPASFLVLALVLDDGTRMLSVVNVRSVLKVDALARRTRRIADHRWYMSQDPYFRDFTCVRSLRARRVSMDVYNEKTAAMQPLALKEP